MLLLLLTISSPLSQDHHVGGDPTLDAHTRTPYLMYAASLLNNMNVEASEKAAHRFGDEDEDDHDHTAASDTQGKTDTDETSSHTSEVMVPCPVTGTLTWVAPFLTLKDLAALRAVSRACNTSTMTVATFSPKMNAVFLRWDSSAPEIVTNRNMLRRTLQWQCEHCSFWNATDRTFCGNHQCYQPHYDSNATAHRLFVGQLRKEQTAHILRWILAMTLSDVDVVHAESHTNPSQGGRGKGCAWLYVRSQSDVVRVMALHQRAYVDVDDEGHEGMWVCGNTDDDKSLLAVHAGHQSGSRNRLPVHPRNCLVVEVPSKSSSSSNNRGGRTVPYLRPPPPMPREQLVPSMPYNCQCEQCKPYTAYPPCTCQDCVQAQYYPPYSTATY